MRHPVARGDVRLAVGHDGTVDDDLRSGLLRLSTAVLDATERAGALVEPTVTATQLRVLAHLGERSASTVSALAEALQVAVSTASRLADRLGAAGLTAREETGDRREVVLVLTRRGREVLGRWLDARAVALAELLDVVDEGDREPVVTALRRLGRGGDVPPATTRATAPAARGAVVQELQQAVLRADPDVAPDVLVQALGELVGASAVTLHVLSQDCRYLVPVASWPQRVAPRTTTPAVERESVERGPAGDAMREGRVVVETGPAGAAVMHAPLGAGSRAGVLGVAVPPSDVDDGLVDVVAALAEAAGPALAAAVVGSRRMQLAARTHEWTVSAETQVRQLGPRHVRARGVEVAGHLEPAWDGATDAYDAEVLAATPTAGPRVDVALLDCRADRHRAPALTALALGALRHARALGLPLAEQARLVDEAVFGHHHGRATVDVLLARVHLQPWRVEALATTDMRVLVQRGGSPEALALPEHEPLGATGDSLYATTELPVVRGERLLLLGDGFGVAGAASTRAEVVAARARAHDVQEVVRQVVADLLERSGPEGPEEDATVVCVDLGGRWASARHVPGAAPACGPGGGPAR